MARSLRQRRKAAQDRRGFLLIVVAVAIVVGGIGAYIYLQRTKLQVDADTLCPISGPVELTVVLFDRTDPLNAVQRAIARRHLEDIKGNVKKHAGIAIYTVGPIGPDLLAPEAKLCNPGRGEEIDPAFGNPRLVERRWRESFSDKLDTVLNKLIAPDEAKTSPIMEGIQSVAVTAFAGEKLRDTPKRLVIISDMLQHTIDFSQYNGVRPFTEFQKTSGYRKVRADLRGVDIEILYVRRDTARGVQGKAHVEFWQNYFADMGGRLVRVVALEG